MSASSQIIELQKTLSELEKQRDAILKEEAQKEAKKAKNPKEQVKKEAEEQVKKEAEEQVKKEAEEQVKKEAEDRAKKEKEKKEAEDRAKKEKEKKEADDRAKKEKKEAEDRAKKEKEKKEKEKREAEDRAKKEKEDQIQQKDKKSEDELTRDLIEKEKEIALLEKKKKDVLEKQTKPVEKRELEETDKSKILERQIRRLEEKEKSVNRREEEIKKREEELLKKQQEFLKQTEEERVREEEERVREKEKDKEINKLLQSDEEEQEIDRLLEKKVEKIDAMSILQKQIMEKEMKRKPFDPTLLELGEKIGQGSFGTAYKLQDQDYVVKRNNSSHDGEIPADVLRELSTFKLLKGAKNVVQIAHVGENFDIYIPAYSGSLANKSIYPMNQSTIKKVIFQILNGLRNMQNRSLYHRDLKPGNVLYNTDTSQTDISDFGSSRSSLGYYGEVLKTKEGKLLQNIDFTCNITTIWYAAPELLYNIIRRQICMYNSAIDVWSAGCIFAYLLRGGKHLFEGDDHKDQFALYLLKFGDKGYDKKYVQKELKLYPEPYYTFPLRIVLEQRFNPSREEEKDDFKMALDLLLKMLVMDPTKRITIDEALLDPYFEGFHPDEPSLKEIEKISYLDKGTSFDKSVLSSHHRSILFGWFYELFLEYGNSKPDVLFATLLFFDLFYNKAPSIHSSKFQGILCACYYIASALYDVEPAHIKYLSKMTDYGYSEDQIKNFIKVILTLLDYNLYLSNEYSYLSQYKEEDKYLLEIIPLLYICLLNGNIRTFTKKDLVETIIGLVHSYHKQESPMIEKMNPLIVKLLVETWKASKNADVCKDKNALRILQTL